MITMESLIRSNWRFIYSGGYLFDARRWFTGPTINLTKEDQENTELEKDKQNYQLHDDIEGGPVTEKTQVSEVEDVA